VVYDSDNRMVAAPGGSLGTVETYEYAPDNRRVVQRTGTGAATVTLWIGSERVATADTDYILFAGRRFRAPLGADPAAEGADRLGSTADHRPYGENATGKFATYERDGTTGLDYADQRYYQPGAGRFMTADPYLASGGVESPGSWNRYAYVEGDPVNWVDPSWPREMPGRCDMCSSDSSHARSRADENGSVLSSSREWNCVGWA
jgi:RHS repeat-associated protein